LEASTCCQGVWAQAIKAKKKREIEKRNLNFVRIQG